MKTIKLMTTMMVLALATTIGTAQPGPGNGNGFKQGKHFAGGNHPSLNLSDEQRAKVKEMHISLQKEILPIQNQLRENKAKMQTLTTAENADLKAIGKLIDENSVLMAKMQKLKAANHQEFRKLLTDEQRVILDSRPQGQLSRKGQGRNQEPGFGRRGNGSGQGFGRDKID